MKLDIEASPGTFYELEGNHFLPIIDIKQGQELVVSKVLPMSCMFEVSILDTVEGFRAGFYFVTRFTVRNGGSYLLTYLTNKSEAQTSETLLRSEHLVIFNYPNRGTLAVSPLVNEEIDGIFTEQ